jgi:aminomethyltransferase
MQTTPLHAVHRRLGASLVPFAGFEMPVQYTGIVNEHHTVRERVGLFDISHMGRIRIRGADADAVANQVLCFDVRPLAVGRTRYALILNSHGGIDDDVLVSRDAEGLVLVVNASNHDHDLQVIRAAAKDREVTIEDITGQTAMIAVQGPASRAVLEAAGLLDAAHLRYYHHGHCPSAFGDLWVSRTGYTGEIGFEIVMPSAVAEDLWNALTEAGREHGIAPCGLGSRDTLRLEAGMPLHGHEIGPKISPLEAGLDFAIRSDLPYTGSDAVARARDEGPRRALIGLIVDGRRIPRQGCPVLVGDRVVGEVCSGTLSPTLNKNIATALLESDAVDADAFTVRIRQSEAPAHRTPLPFYRRRKEQG